MKLLALFFLFGTTVTLAQLQGAENASNAESMASGGMFRSFDNRFKGVEGFPTLFEHYLPGKIQLKNGTVVESSEMNYDVMTNEVLVKRTGREMVLNRAFVEKFTFFIDEDSLNYVNVKFADRSAFVQEMVEGGVRLYKATVKILEGPTNSGAYSNGRTNSAIVQSIKYFWQKEGGEVLEIKNKKSFAADLQRTFGEDYSDFIKSNKLKTNNGEDLVKLFGYINRQKKA